MSFMCKKCFFSVTGHSVNSLGITEALDFLVHTAVTTMTTTGKWCSPYSSWLYVEEVILVVVSEDMHRQWRYLMEEAADADVVAVDGAKNYFWWTINIRIMQISVIVILFETFRLIYYVPKNIVFWHKSKFAQHVVYTYIYIYQVYWQ